LVIGPAGLHTRQDLESWTASDVLWLTDFPDPAAIHSDLLEDIAASNIIVESLRQHGSEAKPIYSFCGPAK